MLLEKDGQRLERRLPVEIVQLKAAGWREVAPVPLVEEVEKDGSLQVQEKEKVTFRKGFSRKEAR
ncbi:MAG: hypothetical protein MSC45_00090 [Mobiluncus sp.]|uniref:hypothetical protein n=1 Tax=Mobiluncus sp. TaxID=47293 RepID=UPI0025899ADE|nr:hypothetical protein [Mobiluncus sp.]MCI6583454.1 hypothetical protein [Mobiluncus sp.]